MDRIAALERMLQSNPGDAQLNYFLATELANAGRLADALAPIRRYLALTPDDQGAAYRMLGKALLASGNAAEARASFEQGIAQALKHGHGGLADELRGLAASIANQ